MSTNIGQKVIVELKPGAGGGLAMARAAPGQLTFASGAIGTSHHLGGVLFASIAGVAVSYTHLTLPTKRIV